MGVIEFNGISSKDLGVEVETFPDYVAPEKEYQVTHVPGRNGDLVVDTKTFQNVPRSYEVSVATNGVPIEVVNAAVARFKSSSRIPIKSLKSEIKAVQDLHGYDHPWPAGGGKNKLNYDVWKTTGITRGTAVWENNGVTLTATANDCYTLTSIDSKIPMSEGETITLSWEETTNKSGQIFIFPNGTTTGMVTVNNGAVKKVTYTATSGITFVTFRFGVANSGDTIAYKNIQIEKGNQATAYEPYSNICPITGFDSGVVPVCGKNLYNKATVTIGKYVTNTGTEHSTTSGSHSDYMLIKKNVPYYFSHIVGLGSFYSVAVYDENKTFIECVNLPGSYDVSGMLTFTKGTYIQVNVNINCIDICQIELGTSATEYTPFVASDIYTIPFGQTVFGGNINFTTGKLKVTYVCHVFDGSESFLTVETNKYLYNFGQNVRSSFDNYSSTICSHFKVGHYGGWGQVLPNEYIVAGSYYIGVNPDMTLTDYKEWLAEQANNGTPVVAIATLQTFQEIQLTPMTIKTLPGENNIFSNIGDVSVKVEPSFSTIINQVVEWLHSASGYARLEDAYEPDYYRMAYYSESLSIENIFNEAGKATLNFICKPQRYLKSGETPVTFTEEGTIQNGTRFSSSPVLKVTTDNTQGSVAIGNHSITIKAGAGTDPITIDCELQDAWSGTTNKNSFIVLTDGEFPVIDPGTQTVTFDGGVQSVEVIPRWWTV